MPSKPGELLGQDVGRPLHQRDLDSAAGSAGPDAHDPAPERLGHGRLQVGPGDRLPLLPGGEVAEVERPPSPPRPARRSPRALPPASSRSPSACRPGSGRERPRPRCPALRSRAASRTGPSGRRPGSSPPARATVVELPFSQPASSIRASSRSSPIDAPTPGSRRSVKRLARLSYRPPERDAAEPLPAVDGRLEDDARVVVEAAGEAEVDLEAPDSGTPAASSRPKTARRLAIPSAASDASPSDSATSSRTSTPPRPASAKSRTRRAWSSVRTAPTAIPALLALRLALKLGEHRLPARPWRACRAPGARGPSARRSRAYRAGRRAPCGC